MQFIKTNWYGFDHDMVNKQFEGGLTYVNDICVNGEYLPSAIYKVAKPNKEKGHKRYLLLTKSNYGFVVRGMDTKEMNKWRYQQALHCLECDSIIYSINRHDYRECSCKKVAIDGGRDYTRTSCSPDSLVVSVILDLLTNTVKPPKTKKKEVKRDNSKSSKRTPRKTTAKRHTRRSTSNTKKDRKTSH